MPALPLALSWPASRWVLIEAMVRRAAFLRRAVEALGLADRVVVLDARAEQAGRDPDLRGRFDLVTARAFGPPPVTAECAAPLLRPGGRLVVSEPPGGGPAGRWPDEGLAELGLRRGEAVEGPPSFAVLVQASHCPERFPRRPGIPGRRPLWVAGST